MSDTRPVSNPPLGFGELTHIYLDPSAISKGMGHQLFSFTERHMMKTDGARADERDWLGEGVFEVRLR